MYKRDMNKCFKRLANNLSNMAASDRQFSCPLGLGGLVNGSQLQSQMFGLTNIQTFQWRQTHTLHHILDVMLRVSRRVYNKKIKFKFQMHRMLLQKGFQPIVACKIIPFFHPFVSKESCVHATIINGALQYLVMCWTQCLKM